MKAHEGLCCSSHWMFSWSLLFILFDNQPHAYLRSVVVDGVSLCHARCIGSDRSFWGNSRAARVLADGRQGGSIRQGKYITVFPRVGIYTPEHHGRGPMGLVFWHDVMCFNAQPENPANLVAQGHCRMQIINSNICAIYSQITAAKTV